MTASQITEAILALEEAARALRVGGDHVIRQMEIGARCDKAAYALMREMEKIAVEVE